MIPQWVYTHLPFVVLALAVPLQLILRDYTAPNRLDASDTIDEALDLFVNLYEDTVRHLDARGMLDFVPFVKVPEPLKPAPKDRKPTELGPIEMTPAKLRRALHNHEYVLLNFYAPWCVHCKRFEPVFDKIAKRLHADTELDIVVGKVDGTQHRHLVERHEIDAYPSILLYADGDIYHPMQYVGLRDPDKMVEWVSAEIGKLESAAEPVSNYYAGSNRARWRIKRVLFRVGETVTLANLPDRAHAPWGVIIGWDYFARGPPEWYSELTPAEKRQAHYLVLWDERAHMPDNPSYLAQDKLSLVLSKPQPIHHPDINKYFRYHTAAGTLEPTPQLRDKYPED